MSDEEYSDLTSEDEVALSIAQKTNSASNRKVKSEKQDDDDYKLQKALKPPRATTYTAQALYGMFGHYLVLCLSLTQTDVGLA